MRKINKLKKAREMKKPQQKHPPQRLNSDFEEVLLKFTEKYFYKKSNVLNSAFTAIGTCFCWLKVNSLQIF